MHLIDALKELFPESSLRTLKLWLKSGRIYVNGKRVTKAIHPVTEKDEVTLDNKKEKTWYGIRFLHIDTHIVVIVKPKNLLSVPQDIPGEKSALRLLRNYFKQRSMYPVHRLDRETSGVMVFARTKEAWEKLKETFYNRHLTREYYALVWGAPAQKKGTWKSNLLEDASGHVHVSDDKKAKMAVSHYEVIKRKGRHTLLRLVLETGKKHQIRVHCSSNELPIVGDDRYGPGLPNPYRRLCLHARTLAFKHPITNKALSFVAEPTEPYLNV